MLPTAEYQCQRGDLGKRLGCATSKAWAPGVDPRTQASDLRSDGRDAQRVDDDRLARAARVQAVGVLELAVPVDLDAPAGGALLHHDLGALGVDAGPGDGRPVHTRPGERVQEET